MVHAGYCGYWWELYRTVTEAAPTKPLLMDDDLGELVQVSEQIAGSAEAIGIDSTPFLPFLLQAEECYYGTDTALPLADRTVEFWLVRVRLALTERERTNPITSSPATVPPVALPATPQPQLPPARPFEFGDFAKQPVVNGNVKPHLTEAEHNVLMALLEAGERGLSKDKLDEKSGHTDARKYLKNLAKDDDWAAVILFPERKGRGGYRLRIS